MSETGDQRDGGAVETVLAADRPIGRRRSDRIVGAGRATQEVVEQAKAAARDDQPVWFSGPAGAGKQHFARAVHAWSSRAGGPFVVVGCASVAPALLQRELFGCAESTHAEHPGAYIGALARATGGTLCIDGANRLPEPLRESLTKVIGDGRFQREGDGASAPMRARVIALSNEASGPGPFAGLPHHVIRLRPLSERPEDVLPLAAHFLRLAAEEAGVKPIGFTADARSALMEEPWTGNVSELAERVRQAVKLAGDGAISAEALLLAADGENVPSFKEAKRAFETRYVVGLLRRCGGNISRAARLAKKDRKDFYDVIRRTGVDPQQFR